PEGDQRDMVEAALHGGAGGEGASPDQEAFVQAQQLAFGDDPTGAVRLLAPMTETYPDSAEIWFILGGAHRRSGSGEEAERCLRGAARLAPTEPFIWLELARAYEEMAQWRPAENAIRKALEVDPENAGFHCALGRILLAQGDRYGAEEAIHKAQELV